jgi:hypothetical protein
MTRSAAGMKGSAAGPTGLAMRHEESEELEEAV